MDLTLRIPDDLARRLLGFATRAELDGLLKARGVDESMTAAELERDRQDLDRLGI